ncbi:Helicase [Neofusicoccum parvum]|nr:Helicase [Neofusicoccum parvum]
MPPRKKRIVTVHSSSDRENGPSEPELKSAKERKPTSRKSVDPTDPDGPPPKKPRGRPRKSAVPDEDGDLSVQKPKRKPRKRPGEDEGEQDDLPDKPAKKQKNNTRLPLRLLQVFERKWPPVLCPLIIHRNNRPRAQSNM